ncbi:gamma-glutamyltransferase [Siccirubricoccus deserti]|uniref:Glutathione hydrolase proenzyme n=1 Tax=Siccirubricoccus deserti TaxID=2013562 RepID=A0A9X0QZF4_9PROT|nr:gamma-glutamyltransferase [Siccirubricoccus deserti]MBC4016088.1 gamma-glutamyltransferase [Siccirubricoccus deserti]GGC46208.1 gamma-glutamyltransferase [Siccirubricoccus deserti]
MHPALRSHRPLIMGRRGAVASNHPVATKAGLDVLGAGGNAMDAAIAVSLALGVVEPHMSGIGGDGFFHLHLANGAPVCINATGAAPAAATPERYRAAGGIPVQGPLSAQTPGLLAGLALLHARHASLPWARLVAPAIEAARDGFASTHTYRHFAEENRARLKPDAASRARFLGPDGAAPPLGGLVVQPELAETLAAIAAEGAAGFYQGALARRLAAGIAAAGGLVAEADLAGCMAEEQAPISVPYRGFTLRQTPPNSTGFTFLQMLRILENFDLAGLDRDSAALIHLMVEAKKRAFLDRESHGADPRGADIPLDRLLSAEHAAAQAALIDPKRAASLPVRAMGEGDTTYFCVVDAAGNVVSAIQSLNSAFGSGVTAGDTGVLLNNRMAYWHLNPGHANLLRPGMRVRHTMNAPIVLKDGRPWAVFGTPGADNQVQVNMQVLVAMAEFGLDPQQALEAPRWTSSQPGQAANYPHGGDAVLTLEEGLAEAAPALTALGHQVRIVPPLEGPCSVEAIRLLENGVRMAASDPRRDGWAAAW